MSEYTDDQRARARALHHQFYQVLTGRDLSDADLDTLSSARVKAWLELEQFVLDSFTTRGGVTDSRVRAWHTMAKHPFFADCYAAEDTLLGAMIAKLDVTHYHVCQQWRQTSAAEIQPGWEIRSRLNGSPQTWGTAHHQGSDGNWYTGTYSKLSDSKAGWILETTAPLVKPDPLIQVVLDWTRDLGCWSNPEDAAELLTKLDALKEGEQS